MDKIYIRDIALRCIVGVYEAERLEKQDVVVNVTLHTDLSKAGETDDFADTVDYKAVKKAIVTLVENSNYFLLEALASAIAGTCLRIDPRIEQVEVLAEKPGALRFARTVGVEICRSR